MVDQGRLSDLAESVLDRINVPDTAVAVALSGGADSAVCAWALGEKGIVVRGVHVDHNWPHSPMMAKAASAVAGYLGIDLEERSIDAPRDEGSARTIRYRTLFEAVDEDEVVATGHTADDQAETILGFILRGTGPEGLTGIPRHRPGVVRPIIDVWREETRQLARLLGIPAVDDPSNEGPGQRNDIRNVLIPHLEEEYNPAVKRALVRMAELVADEHAVITELADSVPVRMGKGTATIPIAVLRNVGRAVAAEVIRGVCRRLHPPYGPDTDAIYRVLDVVDGTAAGAEVGGGITVRIDRALLAFSTGASGH